MPLSAPETRRLNFTAAVDAAGGVEPFCKKFDMNPDYVRQLLRGGGEASGRNIGNRAARTIEAKLGLDPNALDQPPRSALAAQAPPVNVEQDVRTRHEIDELRFAMSALVTALGVSRPDEAAHLIAALQSAPAEFRGRGLLAVLVGALAGGKALPTAAKKAPKKPRALPESA